MVRQRMDRWRRRPRAGRRRRICWRVGWRFGRRRRRRQRTRRRRGGRWRRRRWRRRRRRQSRRRAIGSIGIARGVPNRHTAWDGDQRAKRKAAHADHPPRHGKARLVLFCVVGDRVVFEHGPSRPHGIVIVVVGWSSSVDRYAHRPRGTVTHVQRIKCQLYVRHFLLSIERLHAQQNLPSIPHYDPRLFNVTDAHATRQRARARARVCVCIFYANTSVSRRAASSALRSRGNSNVSGSMGLRERFGKT